MTKRRYRKLLMGETGRAEARVAVHDDPISIGVDKSIRIDMSKLPPPSSVYDADVAWIEHSRGRVSLLFGKLSRNEKDRLRTRLELRYPPEDFVRAFWGNSRDFHAKLRESCRLWLRDTARDQLQPERFSADKDHSEWVNFDAMAHSGTEGTLDFFLLPAPAVARFARGQGSAELRLAPIVRINLSAFELLGLLDQTVEVVKLIQSYLPAIYRAEAGAEEKQQAVVEQVGKQE